MNYSAIIVFSLILIASGCVKKPTLTSESPQNKSDNSKPTSSTDQSEKSDGTKAPKVDFDLTKKVAEELRKMDVSVNEPYDGWPSVFIEAKAITPEGKIKPEVIATVKKLAWLGGVVIKKCNLTDEGLSELANFPPYAHLYLEKLPKLTENGLAVVGKNKVLTQCEINDIPLSTAFVSLFKETPKLRWLKIYGDVKPIPGAFKPLVGHPGLKSLILLRKSKNPHLVTDDDLADVAGIPLLEELVFGPLVYIGQYDRGPGGITDKGIAKLAEAKNLTQLCLNDTEVTSAGLEPLAMLPKLERLYLPECNIKDEGMVHVAKCPSLIYLNLSGTGVTKAGIVTLQKCPKLEQLMLRYLTFGNDVVEAIAGIKTLKELYYQMDDKEKEQLKKLAPMLKISD